MLQTGDAISSILYPDYKGTICCFVRDVRKGPAAGKVFILTCSHVFTNGNSQDYGGVLPKAAAVQVIGHSGEKKAIGKWYYGLQDEGFDIALVEVEDPCSIQVSGFQKKSRNVTAFDVQQQMEITMYGASSGVKKGIITDYQSNVKVTCRDSEFRSYKNLIAIKEATTTDLSITAPGDSGAVIIDANNYVLGMIIAGSSKLTYALPMDMILRHLKMEII